MGKGNSKCLSHQIRFTKAINCTGLYVDTKEGRNIWCHFYPNRVVIQRDTIKYTERCIENLKYLPVLKRQLRLKLRLANDTWYVIHPDSTPQFVDNILTSAAQKRSQESDVTPLESKGNGERLLTASFQ